MYHTPVFVLLRDAVTSNNMELSTFYDGISSSFCFFYYNWKLNILNKEVEFDDFSCSCALPAFLYLLYSSVAIKWMDGQLLPMNASCIRWQIVQK